MTRQEFISTHWNYYLYLEENFIESQKYVFLSKSNYNTFSINFVYQLLSICSEFETTLKTITNNTEKKKNIYILFKEYISKFKVKDIQYAKLIILQNPSITIEPFKNIFKENNNINFFGGKHITK